MPPGTASRLAQGFHRELGRLDAICLLIAAIVVLDTLGAVATAGAQTLVWLAVGRGTGSLVSLVYFVETPVWVGGSAAIMCVAVVDRLLVPLRAAGASRWRWPLSGRRSPWRWRRCGPASGCRLPGRHCPVHRLVGAGPGRRPVARPRNRHPDAHLPDGFVGQRLAFTVAELVPLGLVLLAAFLLARTWRPPAR